MLALPIMQTTVAIPAFHRLGHQVSDLPTKAKKHFDIRDCPDVLAAVQWTGGQFHPAGIWTLDSVTYRHDRPWCIRERKICQNTITDYGATAMLKVVASAAQTQFFNHLQLSADAKTAQLSGAMTSTGVTAIPVISGGAAFTNGMSITLGYGTANTETLTVGSGSTSTSIVCSATTKTHSANDWVVQNPLTSDNPSSVTSGYDSGALAGGAFAYSGAGAGSRQVVVTYNFPTNAGAPGGGYTDMWLASAATIASNTTAAHVTHSPAIVNSTTGLNATYTESF